jgi:hypothetical protein
MIVQRVCSVLITLLMAFPALVVGPAAEAACAVDPNALTFREMIKKGKTGQRDRDTLILGRVVAIKDLEPGKGGDKLAKLAVAESPVGYSPLVARVHFWKPEPGDGIPSENFVYHRRGFYVVVADRLRDGTFEDDVPCGQTRQLTHDRFWNLVRFARDS